jgi:two-component system alkaline phosphatase synthesis response regulator PhoP
VSARVLVVEDELHLAEGIRANLEAEGYAVEVVGDGEAALERWRDGEIDLIVLDVMLPLRDGFSVCEEIRRGGGRVPILFLTAKNTEDDRVRGLEAGGDDYLGKPFNLRELLLRVRGMVRRQAWYGALPPTGDTLRIGEKTVDFRSYLVEDEAGERVLLAQKEIMILKVLAERAGEVVSREEILDRVWGYDVFPSTRTVDNFIVRLRRRFESDPAEPRYFHTVRGVGYRFTPAGPDQTDGRA